MLLLLIMSLLTLRILDQLLNILKKLITISSTKLILKIILIKVSISIFSSRIVKERTFTSTSYIKKLTRVEKVVTIRVLMSQLNIL
jgi:hypothetical protein